MGYLSRTAAKRMAPGEFLPWAKSVVSVALNYNTPYDRSAEAAGIRGWISRYAWGEDYHDVMQAKLTRSAGLRAPGGGAGGAGAEFSWMPDRSGPRRRRAGRDRLVRQEHQPAFHADRLVLLPGGAVPEPGAGMGSPDSRSLRPVPAVPGRLPDKRLRGSLRPGRPQVHLVSHDRVEGGHPQRAAPADGDPHLRMRHLPGRLSLQYQGEGDEGAGLPSPPGPARAGPHPAPVADRGGVQSDVCGKPDPARQAPGASCATSAWRWGI